MTGEQRQRECAHICRKLQDHRHALRSPSCESYHMETRAR